MKAPQVTSSRQVNMPLLVELYERNGTHNNYARDSYLMTSPFEEGVHHTTSL